MKRFYDITALLVLAALTIPIAGCGGGKTEVRPIGEEIAGRTATVELRTLPVTVSATGSVEPEVRVHVSTRMMGWVKTLHVREGDRVEAGQPLLTIDDADMQAKRKQVEAGILEATAIVKNAEKTARRFENLYEAKSVSRQQLDDVLTGLERARAGLRKAEAARDEIDVHLEYLDITAPIDGVVTRRMVEEGDMASPGRPLLYVDRIDRMKIIARLGEKDVNSLSAGDRITVDVTSLDDATYMVEVARVISTANPGSRTYDVEAYVDNDGRLRSGMFARIDVTVGERRGVTVPEDAIIQRGQLRGVFVTDADGTARLRWVRLGDRIGPAGDARIEVISGLSGGETIVLSSDKPLAEGDKVVTQP